MNQQDLEEGITHCLSDNPNEDIKGRTYRGDGYSLVSSVRGGAYDPMYPPLCPLTIKNIARAMSSGRSKVGRINHCGIKYEVKLMREDV